MTNNKIKGLNSLLLLAHADTLFISVVTLTARTQYLCISAN